MHTKVTNKYRAAVEILQQGRDLLVETLADDIVYQGTDLIEGGFLFNEFLEVQGTRLHFLSLLVSQMEQAAESLEERARDPIPSAGPPPVPKRRSKPRPKKLQQKVSSEGNPGDA